VELPRGGARLGERGKTVSTFVEASPPPAQGGGRREGGNEGGLRITRFWEKVRVFKKKGAGGAGNGF